MLLSIIIPIYNREEYIGRCLTSIAQQGLDPESYEVIVVDDCSTDNSVAVVGQYAELIPNLSQYSTSTNSGGPGAPRNVGLDHARGEWVQMLDADDTLRPGTMSRLVEAMVDSKCDDVDILGFDFVVIDSQGRELDAVESSGSLTRYDNIGDFLGSHTRQPRFTSTWYATRRSVLQSHSIKFVERLYNEDLVLMSQLMVHSRAFAHLSLSIYNYYYTDDSIMHSKSGPKSLLMSKSLALSAVKLKETSTTAGLHPQCVRWMVALADNNATVLFHWMVRGKASWQFARNIISELERCSLYPLSIKGYNYGLMRLLIRIYNIKWLYRSMLATYRMLPFV